MKRYQKDKQNKQQNFNILNLKDNDFSLEQIQESNQMLNPHQNINKLIQYKSIQQNKQINMFVFNQSDSQDKEQIIQQSNKKQKKINQIKIQYTNSNSNSKEKFKLNNYFGSKKQIQRIKENKQIFIEEKVKPNPQIQYFNQFQTIQSNQKLTLLVQKQIQEKKKWEQNKNYLQEQQENLTKNKQGLERVKNMSSKNLLRKINAQSTSTNIQKNIFDIKQQDAVDSYIIKQQEQNKNTNQQDLPKIKQKKRKFLPQLNPLKSKLSTQEVLNQLEFLKNEKKTQKEIIIENKIIRRKITGNLIGSLKRLNTENIHQNQYFQGYVQRNRIGFSNSFFPEYHFFLDDKSYVVSAKKTLTGYIICSDRSDLSQSSQNFLGQIKSNIFGTVYNLYEAKKTDEILATYVYKSQFSIDSITRNIQIYAKNNNIQFQELDRQNQGDTSQNLEELYKQGQNMIDKKIIKYINKKSYYNPITKTFELNFGISQIIPSVKNLILIDPQNPGKNLMTFAKNGNDKFYLKIEHPFNILIIVGFLMSSFNFKFLTQ